MVPPKGRSTCDSGNDLDSLLVPTLEGSPGTLVTKGSEKACAKAYLLCGAQLFTASLLVCSFTPCNLFNPFMGLEFWGIALGNEPCLIVKYAALSPGPVSVLLATGLRHLSSSPGHAAPSLSPASLVIFWG